MTPDYSVYMNGNKITYGSGWWDIRDSEFGPLECPQCSQPVEAISQERYYDWQLAPCAHHLDRRIYSLLIHEDSLGWSFQLLDGQPTPVQERRTHLAALADDEIEADVLTTEEWEAACRGLLTGVGLTYEELEAKSRVGTLTTKETKVWYMVKRFEADPIHSPEHWDPGDSHCTACGGSGLVADQERRAASRAIET